MHPHPRFGVVLIFALALSIPWMAGADAPAWTVWREAVQPQMRAFADHFPCMAAAADKPAQPLPATR